MSEGSLCLIRQVQNQGHWRNLTAQLPKHELSLGHYLICFRALSCLPNTWMLKSYLWWVARTHFRGWNNVSSLDRCFQIVRERQKWQIFYEKKTGKNAKNYEIFFNNFYSYRQTILNCKLKQYFGAIPRKLSLSLSLNTPHLIKPEDSLPRLQEPAIWPLVFNTKSRNLTILAEKQKKILESKLLLNSRRRNTYLLHIPSFNSTYLPVYLSCKFPLNFHHKKCGKISLGAILLRPR